MWNKTLCFFSGWHGLGHLFELPQSFIWNDRFAILNYGISSLTTLKWLQIYRKLQIQYSPRAKFPQVATSYIVIIRHQNQELHMATVCECSCGCFTCVCAPAHSQDLETTRHHKDVPWTPLYATPTASPLPPPYLIWGNGKSISMSTFCHFKNVL